MFSAPRKEAFSHLCNIDGLQCENVALPHRQVMLQRQCPGLIGWQLGWRLGKYVCNRSTPGDIFPLDANAMDCGMLWLVGNSSGSEDICSRRCHFHTTADGAYTHQRFAALAVRIQTNAQCGMAKLLTAKPYPTAGYRRGHGAHVACFACFFCGPDLPNNLKLSYFRHALYENMLMLMALHVLQSSLPRPRKKSLYL